MECSCCCAELDSPVEESLPYDELTYRLEKAELSVKVAKKTGQINLVKDPVDDAKVDKSCGAGSNRVNVITSKRPPPKQPHQERLFLRTTRAVISSDEMQNSLEIELRTPRNYEPLPPPPPPPPPPLAPEPPKKKKDKKDKSKK